MQKIALAKTLIKKRILDIFLKHDKYNKIK